MMKVIPHLIGSWILGRAVVDGRLTATNIPFGEIAVGDFKPLECNANISDVDCTLWSDEEFDYENFILIPCGKCIVWDEPEGVNITLEVGLDIEGKLVFPPNTKATIETPFIFVQGILEASSTEKVGNTTKDGLSFILTGTKDEPFFPNKQNEASCDYSFCNVGKKPVAVAGGTLNIKGLSDTCPTWVKLKDVVSGGSEMDPEDYPKLISPPDTCTRELIKEDFESGKGVFKSSLGASDSLIPDDVIDADGRITESNTIFRVTGRGRAWQGPFINAGPALRDCFMPDQVYLLKARYRLFHEDGDGKLSNCHANGTDCLNLNMHTMASDESLKWRTLYETPAVSKSTDGQWNDFVTPFELTEEELSSENFYQMLYFSGPEEGIGIDIDDVQLTLPWADHYPNPDDVCSNLLVNSGADVDEHYTYPFQLLGNLGADLRVETEVEKETNSINSYFALTGRTLGWTSIFQKITKDCIVENSIYTVKARMRVHSPDPVNIRLTIKSFIKDAPDPLFNFQTATLGSCPPMSSADGWVWCQKTFLFTKDHAEAESIDLQFIVEDDTTFPDIDYDDLSVELHSPPVKKFILPGEVTECWDVGAEIVQTSHTLEHKDFNELIITNITLNEEGDAIVEFEGGGIAKPTTEKDDARFAVEIALLSRNILFDAKNDTSEPVTGGGNLVVIHTPNVTQTIQGAEFRHSGQQGMVGRYPIHFHMCGPVEGTLVAKNTIRHSNQRCIVIHATDNTTVTENVAFDTFGHCFMIEDGIEKFNMFSYNLGLETKITPDEGIISLSESDMFPATYWMSNPQNFFLGNVAAGGEDTGFWYEFLSTVRGTSTKLDPTYDINPSEDLFGYHRKNAMHSYHGDGFKLYPNGYFPHERAIFEEVLSFRNVGDGILLHNSANLGLDGCIVADNRVQVEIDKQADDVTLTNSLIIGYSPLYQLEVEAARRKSHCPAYRPLVGVQLHSFLRYRDSKGYLLSNVTFEDFGEEIGCVGSTAIEMDPQVRDGHFDAYSSFENLTFQEGAPMGEKFNMCSLEANPLFLHDLFIKDATGDLNPTGSGEPGYVVSNSTLMKSFNSNCMDMPGSCAMYCLDSGGSACFRTVNIATWNTPDYDDLTLEVTDAFGNSFSFNGYFEEKTKPIAGGEEIPDDDENYVYQRRRYYSPILPYGMFDMVFKKDNKPYWPQLAELIWEDEPPCTPHVGDDTLNFVVPPVTDDDCVNVVRNPGGESGGFNFWGHTGGGIQVVSGVGDVHSGSYALSSVHRQGGWNGIGQFLDTRCMSLGRQYEIDIKIRLKEGDNFLSCNVNRVDFNAHDVCPRVTFRMRKLNGNRIGDGVETNYAYPLASAVAPWSADKWNTLYGMFTVDESMAEADGVMMFVERGRPGVNIIIDDVVIQPIVYGCHMPLYNGDFEKGDTRFWEAVGTTEIDMYSPGYESDYAIRTTKRKEFWGSMSQALNKDCLVLGDTFEVTGMLLLLDENDNIYDCNVNNMWGDGGNMDHVCPLVALRVSSGAVHDVVEFGSMPGPIKSQQWNAFFGQFTITQAMIDADEVVIHFRKTKAGINIVLDNLVVKKIVTDETKSVNNGDFSAGDVRFYKPSGATIDVAQPGADGDSDYSLMVKDRTDEKDGVLYELEPESFYPNKVYKFTAQVFLMNSDLTTFFTCDPKALTQDANVRCPLISLRAQNYDEKGFTIRPIATAPAEFLTGDWNTFTGYTSFFTAELAADSLYILFDKAPPNVVMMLDNIDLLLVDTVDDEPATDDLGLDDTLIDSILGPSNSTNSTSSDTTTNTTEAEEKVVSNSTSTVDDYSTTRFLKRST